MISFSYYDIYQSIVWDDTCSWCSKEQCISNTLTQTSPASPVSEGGNCYVNDDTCSIGSNSPPSYFTSVSPEGIFTSNNNTSQSPIHLPTKAPTLSPTVDTVKTTKLCELKVIFFPHNDWLIN